MWQLYFQKLPLSRLSMLNEKCYMVHGLRGTFLVKLNHEITKSDNKFVSYIQRFHKKVIVIPRKKSLAYHSMSSTVSNIFSFSQVPLTYVLPILKCHLKLYKYYVLNLFRRAINYAINKHEHVCGKCKPLSEYRHLSARIPPTISSAHIPAVVVDNDSVAPTNTTRKASKDNSTLDNSTTENSRAHSNPILKKNEAKNVMQAGKLASPVIASTPAPKRETSNNVRDFIVHRLNTFLNKTKYFTDIVTDTPSDADVVHIESTPSTALDKNEIGDNSAEEESHENENNSTDEEHYFEVSSTDSPLATTQEPSITTDSLKSTSETKVVSDIELNREIREENEKLKRQINKAEHFILEKSETKEEEEFSEKDLMLDFILQNNIISNKKK